MEKSSIKKSISVILPNYNGKHLLEKYIPSVEKALEKAQIDFEIIIIDDASKDDSVNFIKEKYPNFLLLQNPKNMGFSKTCNYGIANAKKDLVLLLNTDVELDLNFFENQWKYFQNEDTFGVMGKIMNFDGKKIEDAARTLRFKGGKLKANQFYYSNRNDETIYTAYLSGANALVDRKKLMLLSGFDEIYSPFYFEDFDLGLRAWQMGWKCIYEHQSICYHQVSASTNTMNKSNFVKIIYNRNSFILQSIHLQPLARFFWFSQILISTVLFRVIKGDFWILKSLKQYLEMKNEIAKSRKNIKTLQSQVISPMKLEDCMTFISESIKNKSLTWFK
jgi:GT2 family glycosyltransferase